jgi:hypothetical protein
MIKVVISIVGKKHWLWHTVTRGARPYFFSSLRYRRLAAFLSRPALEERVENEALPVNSVKLRQASDPGNSPCCTAVNLVIPHCRMWDDERRIGSGEHR